MENKEIKSLIKHLKEKTPEELSIKLQQEVNKMCGEDFKLKHFMIVPHNDHYDLIAHFKKKCSFSSCLKDGKDCSTETSCSCCSEKK